MIEPVTFESAFQSSLLPGERLLEAGVAIFRFPGRRAMWLGLLERAPGTSAAARSEVVKGTH